MGIRNTGLLRGIEIATHCVPSLGQCVPAYLEQLDYQLRDDGRVPAALADAWHAPAMAGLPYALLQPESGAGVYLRFIATGRPGGYWPPVTQGWIATEILTTDPDAVLDKLRGTAFRHIGGPADLYPSPKSARALQMMGPAGELMYFTRIRPGGSRYGLHGAKCFVDRPFIMVVGGTSLDAIEDFYGRLLGQRIFPREPYRIGQMSRVLGLPPDTGYPVAIARIPGRKFLLELEQLPPSIEKRTVPDDMLPEGLAMVSFAAASPGTKQLAWRAPPRAIDIAPYAGREVGVIEGPAGEWLELIA